MEVNNEKEKTLDVGKLIRSLFKYWRLFSIVLFVAFILACIVCFSIPKTYKCRVMLSPEMSSSKSSGGLAALASSFGVNLRGALGNSTEALFPTLYPFLMESVDFKTSLFEIPVTIEGDKENGEPDCVMTYYDYLDNEWKRPWWNTIFKNIVNLLMNNEDNLKEDKKIDPFRLTEEQTEIVKLITKNVVCNVDQKTMSITIEVTDQNPLICATMADSVKMRLQKFITDYRTSKARVDYQYNLKLSKEAEARYEKACRDFANYSDHNQKAFLQEVIQKRIKLENEVQIQRVLYQQVVTQLQEAEMQIQADTPAFTTLQSATVPVRKAGPPRKIIVLVFLFLAFIFTSIWVLYKEQYLESLMGFSFNLKNIINK